MCGRAAPSQPETAAGQRPGPLTHEATTGAPSADRREPIIELLLITLTVAAWLTTEILNPWVFVVVAVALAAFWIMRLPIWTDIR